jgi:alkanesulfonate monooxygenase SsuD/methylene tetrahydromethanopterin reductase-like flavin-dependent oxidoreductase (luciferase family)
VATARQFASLDHLGRGRAGWNLVTTGDTGAAHNFSRDELIAHADRYDRAEEFADVVTGLWDTRDDGSFLRDRESGVYFDPAKVRTLDHRGKHFTVRGRPVGRLPGQAEAADWSLPGGIPLVHGRLFWQ